MANLSYDEAAHLLRRMGFGGPPEEIRALASRGREGAVDSLLNYQQIDNSQLSQLIDKRFDFSDPDDFLRFNRAELQRWWLTRMIFTRRPFEEKITLFWHNYFATGAPKATDLLCFVQNQTLRQHALDRFDSLLLKVAQDPAMLVWLDGIANVLGSPNENFARELQELFTMGITDVVTGEPNYTEDDVKEIARAFTGWKFFRPDDDRPFHFRFFINENEHDNGVKTIYAGTPYQASGNLSGEDVITLLAARRATGRFLVKKFFEFFVYPLDDNETDRATIEKFADVYFNRGHSIRELARAIFTSNEFFSERARFALVKSPVEFIVGAIRALDIEWDPGTYEDNPYTLVFFSSLLGQELFNPPDVSGWRLNLGWVNTAWMLNRFTFADLLAISRGGHDPDPNLALPHAQLRLLTKKNSKKTVKKFLNLLGPLKVDAATVRALENYLDEGKPIIAAEGMDKFIDRKVRGLVHLIMCLAEYQLN